MLDWMDGMGSLNGLTIRAPNGAKKKVPMSFIHPYFSLILSDIFIFDSLVRLKAGFAVDVPVQISHRPLKGSFQMG